MGIITGYLCFVSFLLITLKFIARRCKFAKVNRFFTKLHKPLSCIFLGIAVVHFIFVIPVLQTRALGVIISGVLLVVLAILLITFCHVDPDKKRKLRVHQVMTVLMIVVTIGHIVTYYFDFGAYQQSIRNIQLEGVDLSVIEDGEYIGEYNVGYIYAKVNVQVCNHTITDIEILEHRNERGKAAEKITESIQQEQTTKVDAVSGATNSSLVIRKACEDALHQ